MLGVTEALSRSVTRYVFVNLMFAWPTKGRGKSENGFLFSLLFKKGTHLFFLLALYDRKAPSFPDPTLAVKPPNARNKKAPSSLTGLFCFWSGAG